MTFSRYGVREASRSSALATVSWREVAIVLSTNALNAALRAVAAAIAALA